jgi:hypothetical protein
MAAPMTPTTNIASRRSSVTASRHLIQKGHTVSNTILDDDDATGESPYSKAKIHYRHDSDAFYEYLRTHRLEDATLCLGYYVERAKRERGWNQTDIAERTKTPTDPPLTRSFISAALAGRTGVKADTWKRVADALEANPLEFYLAQGWLDPGDIAAYQVPHASLLMGVSRLMDQVDPENYQPFLDMVKAMIDVVLGKQRAITSSNRR